jgi:hypothetical protein
MRGKRSNANHGSSQVVSSEEIHEGHTLGKLNFLRNPMFHFNEFFLEGFLRERASTIPNEGFSGFFLATLEDQPTRRFTDEEEDAEEDGGEEKVASERDAVGEFGQHALGQKVDDIPQYLQLVRVEWRVIR